MITALQIRAGPMRIDSIAIASWALPKRSVLPTLQISPIRIRIQLRVVRLESSNLHSRGHCRRHDHHDESKQSVEVL
jgi:hypothetical protein